MNIDYGNLGQGSGKQRSVHNPTPIPAQAASERLLERQARLLSHLSENLVRLENITDRIVGTVPKDPSAKADETGGGSFTYKMERLLQDAENLNTYLLSSIERLEAFA